MEKLGTQQILAAIANGVAGGLADWRKLAQSLTARYRVADPLEAAGFVSAVAHAAAAAGGEPDIRLGRGFVDICLYTVDDAGARWVTVQDVELARSITALAAERRLTAAAHELAQVELGLDTADDGAVAPFWSALLTGSPENTVLGSVLDPTGRVPAVWFQRTAPHPPPRQRWHIDLWLPPEVADERIAAAVAAGGTVVDDAEAPSFTVLADPDGNRVCVCTALGRE